MDHALPRSDAMPSVVAFSWLSSKPALRLWVTAPVWKFAVMLVWVVAIRLAWFLKFGLLRGAVRDHASNRPGVNSLAAFAMNEVSR